MRNSAFFVAECCLRSQRNEPYPTGESSPGSKTWSTVERQGYFDDN